MRRRIQRTAISSLLLLWLVLTVLWAVSAAGYLSQTVAMVLGLLFAVVVAAAVPRFISEPLFRVAETAEKIAEGDLTKTIQIHESDEVGKLAQSFNQMAQRLRGTLSMVTQEKNRMQAILDSMADGVIAVDGETRVILINPVVEEAFGLNEEASLGKTVLEVVRDYELDRLFRQALDSGRPVQQELRILTPDPRLFRVHLTPLRGAQGGVVALFRDITERRQLEKMRTEFVANASHELRTPLTSIRGFIETLWDGALDDPETARRFLTIIDEETRRLNELVDDLLKLATIEERRNLFRRQPVELAEVVQRAVEIFETRARQKGLRFSVELPADLPPVAGDVNLLSQVFINLLDNAVKFTDKGEIGIRAWKEDGGVAVEVRDTGIGITPEHLSRIFERFFRADKSRTSELGGTGLGLAIVKHIVEGHGGEVRVTSRPGEGSAFTVLLSTGF
jgi:two-component system phosphate regulon sensor histidine kinase PhoR